MQQGILCMWHGGGKEDAFQSLVHLAHHIGGGCQQSELPSPNVSRSAAAAALFLVAQVKAGSCHSACSFATALHASSADSLWGQPCLHGRLLAGNPTLMLGS
jgi:hypothetical protein